MNCFLSRTASTQYFQNCIDLIQEDTLHSIKQERDIELLDYRQGAFVGQKPKYA